MRTPTARRLPVATMAVTLALLAGAAGVREAPGASPPKPAAGASSASASAGPREPAVDLRAITWVDGVARAPLRGGGEARLTLDERMTTASAKLLAQASPDAGAIVVLDARTGRVLVWTDRRKGTKARGTVLFEEAPSASLMKIVTTAALLEEGVDLDRRVCTRGGEHGIAREHLTAPTGDDVLCTRFFGALGYSRNAVYAQLVTSDLPWAALADKVAAFHVDGPLPFAHEVAAGHVTLPYGDLEFARTAAGFEAASLSPLGAANLAWTVASRGQVRVPLVVDSAPGYTPLAEAPVLGKAMGSITASTVRRMMEVTVHAGTSLEAFSRDDGASHLGAVRVAGKTGTLQRSADDPTTSWFVGFAPSTSPEIVVAVLLQNGPVWRRKANEVARDVLRAWFAARGVRGVTDPFAPAAP